MIMTGFGIGDLLVILVVAFLGFVVPLTILFLLFRIYSKLKDIEEELRKK